MDSARKNQFILPKLLQRNWCSKYRPRIISYNHITGRGPNKTNSHTHLVSQDLAETTHLIAGFLKKILRGIFFI